MASNLHIEECIDKKIWDKFLISSENKNFFALSEFLNHEDLNIKKYFIKKNNETIGSFHVFFSNKTLSNGDNIYISLNYKNFEKKNISSQNYKKLDILNTFINYLSKNFDSGSFTLDYSINDLRPFFWYNFEKKKNFFIIDEVRYTSIIKLDEEFKSCNIDAIINSNLFNNFSRSIKQQIKNSQLDSFKLVEKIDLDFAFDVINKTYSRQSKKLDFNIKKIKKIYELLSKNNYIKMFITEKNNEKKAFTLFGIIDDKSIYLNGGRLDEDNNDYSLTFNLAVCFTYLQKLKIKTLDLEGINSPNRGFWKQGFGGETKPYYKILLNNN